MATRKNLRQYLKINSFDEIELFQDACRLECTVCLYPQPPMYQCSNGHLLCTDCERKLTHCPTCRVDLTIKVRNILADQIIEALPPRCKFAIKGCRAFSKTNFEKLQHEKICPFRLVNCPCDSDCRIEVHFNGIMKHVEVNHKPCHYLHHYNDFVPSKVVNKPAFQLGRGQTWSPNEFAELHSFVFCDVVQATTNDFHFWIYIMGSEKEAERFTFKIKFESNKTDGHAPTLQFSNQTVSIDVPRHQVIEQGRCLTLHKTVVEKQFWDRKKHRLRFEVTIDKKPT